MFSYSVVKCELNENLGLFKTRSGHGSNHRFQKFVMGAKNSNITMYNAGLKLREKLPNITKCPQKL